MNDIDRLLYATTGIALASVFLLDDTFTSNLFRAIGGEIPTLLVNPWAEGLSAVFLVLTDSRFTKRGRDEPRHRQPQRAVKDDVSATAQRWPA